MKRRSVGRQAVLGLSGANLALASGLVLGLVSFGAVSAQALTLGVPVIQQEKTNWCWAASSKSVLNYHGAASGASQCTIVKKAKGGACPNETGSFYGDLDEIYNAYSRAPGTKVAWLTNFATLKSRVDAGRPPQVRYGYPPFLSSGHVVTVMGYQGTDKVYWIDPADGKIKNGTWGHLSSNSSWTSTHTRYNQGV